VAGYFDDTQAQGGGFFDDTQKVTDAASVDQNTGTAGDLATSVKRGILDLPGVVTGLADLPFALAAGIRPVSTAAEWVGEKTGFRPGKWADEAKQEYSPGYQQAQQEIDQAWDDPNTSAMDVAKAYVRNPAYVANAVVESLPSTLAGGFAGRAIMGAGAVAQAVPAVVGAEGAASRIVPQMVGYLERKLGEKTAAAVASGAGEGLVQAGSAMNEATGEDQRKNAVAALGSGLVDAIIGAGAGSVAQKLGFETIETAMAKGFNRMIADEVDTAAKLGQRVVAKGTRMAGGAAAEGILQELPQSAQEQVWANYAAGKDLWDGVPRSAVEGALAGMVMGAGANVATPDQAKANAARDKVQSQTLTNITKLPVTVENGVATVQADQPFTMPAADLAEHFVSGGTLDTLPKTIRYGESGIPASWTPPQPTIVPTAAEVPADVAEAELAARITTQRANMSQAPLTPKAVAEAEREARAYALRQNYPTTITAAKGAPFKNRKAAADNTRIKSAAVLYEFVPQGDGVVAVRLDTDMTGAVAKADGTGFATRKALTQVASRAGIDLTDYQVRDTSKGFIATPLYRPALQRDIPGSTPTAPVQSEMAAPAVEAPAAPAPFGGSAFSMERAVAQGRAIAKGESQSAPQASATAASSAPASSPRGAASLFSSGPLSNPLEMTSADVPKFKTQAEVDAFKTSLREQGYDGVYLTDKQQSFSLDPQAVSGETAATIVADLKSFLGTGYDNLVKAGKLEVVQSMDDAKATGIPMRGATGKVAGVYNPKLKKVVLIADNISQGDGRYVMTHEGAHALLREDPVFMKQRSKILADFLALVETSESVRAAIARVPSKTDPKVKDEEALAHWLQDRKNYEATEPKGVVEKLTALYKRLVSAVKAALFRAGLPHGRLTEMELARIFVGGVQAWSMRAGKEAALTLDSDPQALFSAIDDTLKSGQERITQAVTALANPKSTLRGLYIQHAPKWLAVTPLRTLVQTFGKTIPQVKSFAEHLDAVVSTKTAIVDDAKVLYDKAKELAEKGPGLQAFNWAAAVASFNRMTPWLPMLEQDWVDQSKPKGEALIDARQKWIDAGMKKATGKTFDAAYKQAADLYNGLGNNGVKEAYQHIVDHLGVLRNREKNNLLAYIEKVSKDNPELRKELMARFNTSFSTLNGSYWPLSRVGDFRLEYTDSEGFRTVKHYTTLAERRADMAELTEQGAKDFMESFKDKRPRSEVAIPSMLMDQLSGAVLEKYLNGVDQADESQVANARAAAQDVIDDMNQIWLRWQPETSALANSIRRGNVKGFHEDSLRSYLDYTSRHASNIAWTEQGRKIEADLAGFSEDISKAAKEPGSDTTLDKMILNDLRARVNALRTVQVGTVASVLGKVSTAYYMTSPSIALVQMSQLGVLTLPKLAVKYGAGRAGKALATGIKEAFTKKFTRDAMFADTAVNIAYEDLHRVVTAENRDLPEAAGKELGDDLYSEQDKLRKIAQLTPYQKQLLVLRESMAKNLLDISAAHEAYELTQGKNPDSPMAKAFRYAMLPMSLSELASRKATILSTYELANAEGKNFFAAMGDIGDVVNDTLYSYAKENKPVALQGGVARVIAQFQWYRIMTAIRLAQLFNNSIRGESPEVKAAARKEFAGIMGMTTLLAGVLGTPLSMVFSALSLFSDEDEPEDYELLFQNWLRDTLGETGANVVAKGLPTLAGTDLSKRLGLSDIYGMQGEAPAEKHGRDLAAWYAGSLVGGPIFSIWSNAFQAYDEMVNKGNYMRGLETAMPKPIKDAMKAYRLWDEGLKTGAGKKLLSDEKIGPDELIMQALGFSPDEVATAQSANTSLTRLSTAISERRGRLIRDAAKAVIAGDRGDTLEAIRAWNAKNPRFAIRGQDIRPAIKKMIRGEMGVTGVRERAVAEVYEVPVYVE
jgi:hypothetical protein